MTNKIWSQYCPVERSLTSFEMTINVSCNSLSFWAKRRIYYLYLTTMIWIVLPSNPKEIQTTQPHSSSTDKALLISLIKSQIFCIQIRNSCIQIRNFCIRIRNSCIQIRNSCIRIRNSCIQIQNSCIGIRNSCIQTRNSRIQIRSFRIKIRELQIIIQSSKTIIKK